jgi:hypothetical protein
MSPIARLFAADCTLAIAAGDRRLLRGHLLCLHRPDGGLWVLDADSTDPIVRMDRPHAVRVHPCGEAVVLSARDATRTIRLIPHDAPTRLRVRLSPAGPPVATDAHTGEPLVRCDDALVAPTSLRRFPLAAAATVTPVACVRCGLPQVIDRPGLPARCLDTACAAAATPKAH